ncbi:MAG: hypothetical protein D4Q77_00690 [Methanothrix sp.]|nr:MAG: hypothetical protein D4Q77_00690 [Methanothrix sp.]
MKCVTSRHITIFLVLCIGAFPCISSCSEDNELWLFISSYEDIDITVQDLAFFLATHGYDARPNRSYVTVKLSDDETLYLTPNGAVPRLADIWVSPPASSGMDMVIPAGAIQKDAVYSKTTNREFVDAIDERLILQVASPVRRYSRSQRLAEMGRGLGYNVKYMYDPDGGDERGTIWVMVEDPDNLDTWLAVDSYDGALGDNEYYAAQYSFEDIGNLDFINPKWKLA